MSDIVRRFSDISRNAEKLNSKNRDKRFIIMTHTRNHKITEVGIYDSKSKKYALTDVRAANASDMLDDMEKLIRAASLR